MHELKIINTFKENIQQSLTLPILSPEGAYDK